MPGIPSGHSDLEQDVRGPILQMTKLSLREAWRLTGSHSWREVGDRSSPALLHSQVLLLRGRKTPWGLNHCRSK